MPPSSSFLRRLLHRWLVEYNPLYLLSAALVLSGVTLLSRGLVRAGSLHGQLGVTAIAELYAWALIGGAAFLERLRLRRPAVMLALLTALYQGDLTLHTETASYLGVVGQLASLAWLGSFVAKLVVLARVLKLRVSSATLAIPVTGAAGLVVFPSLLQRVTPSTGTMWVAAFVFALFAFGLWIPRSVESRVELDPWGRTVLRRSLRAVWVMWTLLLTGHVLFWCSTFSLESAVLVPAALLLWTRTFRSEALVWATALATLAAVASTMPSFFWGAALGVAGLFALHAFRRVQSPAPRQSAPATPYRTTPEAPLPTPACAFAPTPRPARIRLLTGSLFAVYLSLWTLGWSGGPWPEHALALDAAVTLAAVLSARGLRVRAPFVPLPAVYLHWALQASLVTAPAGPLQWGVTSVVAGFALLLGSLAVAWRLQHAEPGDVPPGPC